MEIRILLDNGSYSDMSEWYRVDDAFSVAKFAAALLKWARDSKFHGRKYEETPSLKFQFRKAPNPKRTLF